MGKNLQIWIALLLVIGLKGQTTTWNGTAWSAGVPNANISAIISGNYSLAQHVSAKNLTINSGVTYNVLKGYSLIVVDNFINNGTIHVESDAVLIQRNGSIYSGSGIAIIDREAKLKKNGYNFWSSPVVAQNLYNFSPGTPTQYFYRYNESTDIFDFTGLNSSSFFAPAVGYAIRGKQSYSSTIPTVDVFKFIGVPHNGEITVTLKKSAGVDKGYNLVGNPYPSNISFRTLSTATANKNVIFNKQWLWTNLNDVTSQQGSNYSGNNYATFVGGVGGVGPTYVSGNIEEISLRPNDVTKVGQGFLVQAKYNNAILKFANQMRVSVSGSSIFFNKNGTPETEEEPEEDVVDRYWLKFVNPDNIANNILVAHINEATNDYDEDYDSSLFSLGNDAFYSVIGTNKLQIQARALPIGDSDVINLGYKNSKAGSCVIALNDKDGVFKNNLKAIYLKDNETGTVTNLQDGYYTFSSEVVAAENETRFSILYENNVLAADAFTKNDVVAYKHLENLVVRSNSDISDVQLYDASGKLVTSASGQKSKEIKLSTVGFAKGVYILKITSDKGVTTKKVIL